MRGRLFVHAAIEWLLGVIVAAGLILLIRWLYWLIRRREGIGLGDAKLMALLAAWLGLPGALLAFVLGVVLGALAALGQLAIPAARNQSGKLGMSKLPLGTFLCIGGIVSSLWGQPILAAYLRWAGLLIALKKACSTCSPCRCPSIRGLLAHSQSPAPSAP